MADSSKDFVNTVTIKVSPFFKHAPETWSKNNKLLKKKKLAKVFYFELTFLDETMFFLPAGSSSYLLYLKDTLLQKFSCGVSVSVYPAPASSSSSGIRLFTANGFAMTCSGSRIISLLFGSKRFQWTFSTSPSLRYHSRS